MRGGSARDRDVVSTDGSEGLQRCGDSSDGEAGLVLPKHESGVPALLASVGDAGGEGGEVDPAVLSLVLGRGLADDDLVEGNAGHRVDLHYRGLGEVAARGGEEVGAGGVLGITGTQRRISA